MSDLADAVRRLQAWRERRAIPRRSAFTLDPDPERCLVVVPVRLSGDRRLVGVAWGPAAAPPRVLLQLGPVHPESPHPLLSFAQDLLEAVCTAADARAPARVWVAHRDALATLELLGIRLAADRSAGHEPRRLGLLLRELAVTAELPGQRVVAVAGDLLAAHVATGQSTLEDRHLPSLLAWLGPEPERGLDPAGGAGHRRGEPGDAGLGREADDRLDALLGRVSRGQEGAAEAEAIVQAALEAGWRTAVAARAAFWGLGLEPAAWSAGSADLTRRLASAVRHDRFGPPGVLELRRRALEVQAAADAAETAGLRGDRVLREAGRWKGSVIGARPLPVDPERPRALVLETRQPVVRARTGTALSSLDGTMSGVVTARQDEPGRTRLTVWLVRGVRAARRLQEDTVTDWVAGSTGSTGWGDLRTERAVRRAARPGLAGLGEGGA